ncbi:MAG: cupin domain-containing protein [Sneathiellaceae bacterium]
MTAPSTGEVPAGRLHVVEPATADRGPTARTVDIVMDEVPEIEGKPNAGFSYGIGPTVDSHGIVLARGRFAPNGAVTPHRTANLYIVQVVRGSGRLDLYDTGGKARPVQVANGDTVVLPAGTLHRWVSGDEPFEFVGIECTAPQ